jgi:hypothetical protein
VSDEIIDPPTCGKGLAANAGIPSRMADFLSSLADNLEAHLPTIDQNDPHGMVEHDAYLQLIHTHREIATQLHAAAALMAAHRDLPMAPHREEAFADPRIVKAFREYVRIEGDLADLLDNALKGDRARLNEMDRPPSTEGSA